MNILTVASMIDRKLPTLNRAVCQKLFDDGHDIHYRWIGCGSKAWESVMRRTCVSPFLEVIPRVNNLAPHFEWADVFLLLSRDEGFGMVFIESVLCGTPFVCSAGQGGEEVVAITGGGVAVTTDENHFPATASDASDAILNMWERGRLPVYIKERASGLTNPRTIRNDWSRLITEINQNS